MEHPQIENYRRNPILSQFRLTREVEQAKRLGKPIVALESTVITHGLPWPENIKLAAEMEKVVAQNGAVPATIAVLDGQVRVGLTAEDLEVLAQDKAAQKISLRDFGTTLAQGSSGGTTVAATMFAAEKQGIQVFATGGIGGVHRNAPFDVSADLMLLGRCPVLVVCAGAKSILDIPATVEYLETQGVPVIGYQTDDFPAFYSVKSGLKVHLRVDDPSEIARIAQAHWSIGLRSGILVVVPPPAESALPFDQMEDVINQALQQAEVEGIRGSAMTPYLLARVSQLTGGESLKANLALLLNNAAVGAKIAVALANKIPLSTHL